MKENIEINERLYEQIKVYCDTNGIDIKDYLYNLIEKGFFVDKYGDLNLIRNEVLNIDNSLVEVKNMEIVSKDTILLITSDNNSLSLKSQTPIVNNIAEVKDKTEVEPSEVEDTSKRKKTIVKRKIESK